ncbi:MAG: VTT domain-containing protein [Thermodesulfobacteriota bacterium]|nr:VTT domain-containing protein [Thermodesulfobacteriota bacterium]
MLKRLYDWVLQWADRPGGPWALFLLAFAESSFFPIPPDVLLIALAVGRPKKSIHFALVCSLGSLLGGCLGYFIGWQFMGSVGESIISFYGLTEKIEHMACLYRDYDAWAVSIAGFTPLPYKLFTITAGALSVSFPVFFIASACSRTLRFLMVGGLIFVFGPKIQIFINKYFNILSIVFVVLLVAGFAAVKFLF